MTLIIVAAIVGIVWFVCGLVNYGYTFGYFQRKWPELAENHYKSDRGMAIKFALGGIPGLIGSFISSHGEFFKYGFKWS